MFVGFFFKIFLNLSSEYQEGYMASPGKVFLIFQPTRPPHPKGGPGSWAENHCLGQEQFLMGDSQGYGVGKRGDNQIQVQREETE